MDILLIHPEIPHNTGCAARLAAASGLRNLVAHRYGAIDWRRLHEIASAELGDLEGFCQELADRAGGEDG